MQAGSLRAAVAASLSLAAVGAIAPPALAVDRYRSVAVSLTVSITATPSPVMDPVTGVPDYDSLSGSLHLQSSVAERSVSVCGTGCPDDPFDTVGTTTSQLQMSTSWVACRNTMGQAVTCASATTPPPVFVTDASGGSSPQPSGAGDVREAGEAVVSGSSTTRVRDAALVATPLPATVGLSGVVVLAPKQFLIGLDGLHALLRAADVSGSRVEEVVCGGDENPFSAGVSPGSFLTVGTETYSDGAQSFAPATGPACSDGSQPGVPDPIAAEPRTPLYFDPGEVVAAAEPTLCPDGLGPLVATETFGQSPQLCGVEPATGLPSGSGSAPISFSTPALFRASTFAGEDAVASLESPTPPSDAAGVLQGNTDGIDWTGTISWTYKITGKPFYPIPVRR